RVTAKTTCRRLWNWSRAERVKDRVVLCALCREVKQTLTGDTSEQPTGATTVAGSRRYQAVSRHECTGIGGLHQHQTTILLMPPTIHHMRSYHRLPSPTDLLTHQC
ncbi:unnamed protein product, partial [Ectocarpus fasciculatus]